MGKTTVQDKGIFYFYSDVLEKKYISHAKRVTA